MFAEPEDGKIKLYAVNELQKDSLLSYKVTNIYNNTLICEGEATAVADSSVEIAEVEAETGAGFYLIEWYIDGVKHTNHYTTKTQEISYKEYLQAIEKCEYDEFSGFSD